MSFGSPEFTGKKIAYAYQDGDAAASFHLVEAGTGRRLAASGDLSVFAHQVKSAGIQEVVWATEEALRATEADLVGGHNMRPLVEAERKRILEVLS